MKQVEVKKIELKEDSQHTYYLYVYKPIDVMGDEIWDSPIISLHNRLEDALAAKRKDVQEAKELRFLNEDQGLTYERGVYEIKIDI